MATAEERDRLRADIGTDGNTFSDAELDAMFTEAASVYADRGDEVVYAYARIIAMRRLIAATIPQVAKYRSGESSEDRTPVLAGQQALLKIYEQAFEDTLQSAGGGALRFARLNRAKPKREREWPNA